MAAEPSVYLGMSQTTLDRQYEQRTLVPDVGSYFSRWRDASAATARSYGQPIRLAYGPRPWQYADVFLPEHKGPEGLHIHYHGGAWKALDSESAWWLAESWLAEGWQFASVNFGLVPDISLNEQVTEARQCLAKLPSWLQGEGFGLPGRILVSGHSSGAHLAAMAALTGRARQAAVDTVILASGCYDLAPVQRSARNDYLSLTEEVAFALSPVHHLLPSPPATLLVWSRNELTEFRRQAELLARAMEYRGAPASTFALDVPTHFDTWELITPDLLRG